MLRPKTQEDHTSWAVSWQDILINSKPQFIIYRKQLKMKTHGLAALELGELLESYPEYKAYYYALAQKYYMIAAARGNPQYLSRKIRD